MQEPVLLICDSVDAQRCRSFANLLETHRTTHFLGEPSYTHVWQLIDRHCGKTLRDLYAEACTSRQIRAYVAWQGKGL